MTRAIRWRSTLAAFLFAAALPALPAAAATFTVKALTNNTFVPSNLTIQVGDTVTFVNQGNGFHNVIEDDRAWSCAEGCDDSGGDGSPSASDWSFSRRFDAPGVVGYYCDVHGTAGTGMFGRINVVRPGAPGQVDLTASSFSVTEGAPNATITARRSGGATGAISVAGAATAETASLADFTPVSGRLAWADGDSAVKTFSVPIANDDASEADETVRIALGSPAGGATIGRGAATLTILDDDAARSPGTLAFATAGTIGDRGGEAQIAVTRSGGSLGAVSVAYSTSDGTATAGSDYEPSSGTVAFAPGETGTKTITLDLAAGGASSGLVSFSIALSDPTGGATLGSPAAGVVLIREPAAGVGALTASEVDCDGGRLAGLLARSTVAAPRNAKTANLAVSFTGTGDFAGIATSGNGPGTPEAALAFSSNPEETTLLRNPTRPQLFSVSVTRNELNSDLVAAGNSEELRLRVNPTLDANPPAGNLLAIDNLPGAAGHAADAKPGRGLAPILDPCHGDFGARDVHLFRTLAKIARGEAAGAKSVEIAIYRGEAPGTYRIDATPIGADGLSRGRLAVLLEVAFTPAGELASGTLHLLPRCTAGQTADCTNVAGTAAVALFKPVISGFPPATTARVGTAGPTTAPVDFASLLGGTSWRKPI